MASLSSSFTLANQVSIPCLGFGTFMTPSSEIGEKSVLAALKVGYRLIDTASAYENEGMIGKALQESGLPREEVFLTTKLWNADQGFDATLTAFRKSLKKLGTDYLDLYLIHWPVAAGHRKDWPARVRETWAAFEKLYQDGKVRAIGVCNFLPRHFEALLSGANVPPMVNQIEFNPFCQQKEVTDFCRAHGILVEAWGPMQRGKVFRNPAIQEIAAQYGKDPGQICLKWELQQGILPLPKSVHPDRIQSNADVFDFELSDETMAQLSALSEKDSYTWDPHTSAF